MAATTAPSSLFVLNLLREVIGLYQPGVADRPERLFDFTHTLSDQAVFFFHQRVRQRFALKVCRTL